MVGVFLLVGGASLTLAVGPITKDRERTLEPRARGSLDVESVVPRLRDQPVGEGILPEGEIETSVETVEAVSPSMRGRTARDGAIAAARAMRDANLADARARLESGCRELRALRDALPGTIVLNVLEAAIPPEPSRAGDGDAEPPQLGVLLGEIARARVALDPQIELHARAAERAFTAGRMAEGAERLRVARDALVADLALDPVDEAYARFLAALTEVTSGRAGDALRLIEHVPAMLERVQVSAPLVHARFELRAAAVAADAGDWPRAAERLSAAVRGVSAILAQGTPIAAGMHGPAPVLVARQLEALAADAGALRDRAIGGRRPTPREIRALALRTFALSSALDPREP